MLNQSRCALYRTSVLIRLRVASDLCLSALHLIQNRGRTNAHLQYKNLIWLQQVTMWYTTQLHYWQWVSVLCNAWWIQGAQCTSGSGQQGRVVLLKRSVAFLAAMWFIILWACCYPQMQKQWQNHGGQCRFTWKPGSGVRMVELGFSETFVGWHLQFRRLCQVWGWGHNWETNLECLWNKYHLNDKCNQITIHTKRAIQVPLWWRNFAVPSVAFVFSLFLFFILECLW